MSVGETNLARNKIRLNSYGFLLIIGIAIKVGHCSTAHYFTDLQAY